MLNEQRVLAVLSLAFLVVAGGLCLREGEPPPVRDEPASGVVATEFGVARAKQQLAWIAATPHPMVSRAHREVRERLVSEFKSLGLEVVIDAGFVDAKTEGIDIGLDYVQNVVARLAGASSANAILVASHYDSAGTGPGAGDDGAGVAAMLETARALVAQAKKFANDVIFVVTDGEEIDLLGAKRYVQHGPWRENVAAVLNFEARGAAGPSILFETSRANASLIERYGRVAKDPVANSLAYEIYRLMPNDTDLTVFKKAGFKGLNFAFIGAHDHYHTALDTPEGLSDASLQHHGEQMLGLVRDLADQDLSRLRDETAAKTYFSILRSGFVAYPQWGSYLVALAALLLLWRAIRASFRMDRITKQALRDGVIANLLAIALASGASFALRSLLTSSAANDIERNWLVITDGPLHRNAHYLIAISLLTFIQLQMRTRARADGLFAGALLVAACILVVVTIVAPGASYVLSWPLVFSSLSLEVFTTRERKGHLPARRFVTLCLLAIPAIVLVAPLLVFGAQALTLGGMPVIAAFTVLALGFVTPLVLAAMAVRRLFVPLVSGALAFVVLGAAIWNGNAVRARPRMNTLQYVLDAEAGTARLAGATLDAFEPEFSGLSPQEIDGKTLLPTIENGKLFAASVEPVSVQEPKLELVSAKLDEKERVLELRIVPPLDVDRVTLRFDRDVHAVLTQAADVAPDAKALEKSLATQRGKDEKAWRPTQIRLHGCPAEGVVVRIAAPAGAPITGAIVGRYYELPTLSEQSSPRRPWLVPASWRTDSTIVFRRFMF